LPGPLFFIGVLATDLNTRNKITASVVVPANGLSIFDLVNEKANIRDQWILLAGTPKTVRRPLFIIS
jgi:hypothetical protein